MAIASKKTKDNETGILLEAGTNELEVLRFTLDALPFGINVAKLREIIPPPEVRRMEQYHPAFEGVFMLRERAIPLFGLRTFLGLSAYTAEQLGKPRSSLVLVTEFNMTVSAYRVDTVDRIWRVTSEQIEPPPRVRGLEKAPITAMITLDGKPMPMLDFETIYNAVTDSGMILPDQNGGSPKARQRKHVVVVEDSATIRKMMVTALEGSGYQLKTFENGKAAWDWLTRLAAAGQKTIAQEVDVIITDIEMPQMDGLQLCRMIREHAVLRTVPVVLFSSLVSEDNKRKGDAVGATAQISKPQLDRVVNLMDNLLGA